MHGTYILPFPHSRQEEAANAQVTLKDMNQGQQATMAIEEAIAQIH